MHDTKHLARNNIINCIIILLKKSQELYEKNNFKHKDCFVDIVDDDTIIQHIQNVFDIAFVQKRATLSNMDNRGRTMSIKTFEDDEDLTENEAKILKESLTFLWNLPGVRATYRKRNVFYFLANMDYFLGKLEDIFDINYKATIQDFIECDRRTSGIIDCYYNINDVSYHIFDVGGQRNERKKWIQLFDGVNSIVFVAALNHYASRLFENETQNALEESMQLFDEICNARWFRRTEIILLLTKKDLFRSRLKDGISLKTCFDHYDGPEYNINDQKDDENDKLEECYQFGLKFIQNEFEELNRNQYRTIYVHLIDTINRENVEKVWIEVSKIVADSNLMH